MMERISYTVRGASEATGISVDKLYRLLGSGRLVAKKIGQEWIIRREALQELVEGSGHESLNYHPKRLADLQQDGGPKAA